MNKVLFLVTFLVSSVVNAANFQVNGPCEVHFSPDGGAEKAIVKLIDGAHTKIHVLAYSFTSKPIANALIAAKQRGVDVNIVLDRSQPTARGGQMQTVMAAGIPVWVDSKHAIAHNKVVLVDGDIFETGSFNFTYSAEHRNGENALICPSTEGYNMYFNNWTLHQSHSVRQ